MFIKLLAIATLRMLTEKEIRIGSVDYLSCYRKKGRKLKFDHDTIIDAPQYLI